MNVDLIELCYGELRRYFIKQLDSCSEFTEVPFPFDERENMPCASQYFNSDDPDENWYARGRITYPLPLLRCGIKFLASPDLNDDNGITQVMMNDIKASDGLICVIELTLSKILRRLLKKIIRQGRRPDSILFIVIHTDGSSTSKHEQTMKNLLVDLKKIDANFDHTNVLCLNPKTAIDIFLKYSLYTKDYSTFLSRITAFIGRSIVREQSFISAELGRIPV